MGKRDRLLKQGVISGAIPRFAERLEKRSVPVCPNCHKFHVPKHIVDKVADLDELESFLIRSVRAQKARKEYVCDQCQGAITVGEVYTRLNLIEMHTIEANRYVTEKLCAHCQPTENKWGE